MIPYAIETPRLVLRAPEEDDATYLYDAIRDSIPSLRPWIAWAQTAPSLEMVRKKTMEARALMDRGEYFAWRMFLKDTDVLVGSIDLHRWDWSIPKCEIGYWGRTGYGGQGLVTEAVRAVLKVASECLGVRRVEAMCDLRNDDSQRLAARAGFTRESVLPGYEEDVNGEMCDQVLLVRTFGAES